MLMEYFDKIASNHRAYKGGPWCYEDGLIYRGLEMLFRATGDANWAEHIKRMVDIQITEGPGLRDYVRHDYNIDNIMAGRALLFLDEWTGDPKYMELADLLAAQLSTHPRTQSGVYWHKLRYPWQVWLDGLYMGPPFQIGYGQRTGRPELVADSLTQVSTALDMTFVPETGLYAHAVDEARAQSWANAGTGHSAAHWARALGWLAIALVDIRDLVGEADFAPLRARTVALLERIAELQVPGGLWLQVIDQPELAGNYEESSASAMFVYAFLKARNLGLWTGKTEGMIEHLIDKTVAPAKDGGEEMVRIVHVAGLGYYRERFRDGSAEYYVSEALTTDDPKGVGPLMMAVATHLAGQGAAQVAVAGQ